MTRPDDEYGPLTKREWIELSSRLLLHDNIIPVFDRLLDHFGIYPDLVLHWQDEIYREDLKRQKDTGQHWVSMGVPPLKRPMGRTP